MLMNGHKKMKYNPCVSILTEMNTVSDLVAATLLRYLMQCNYFLYQFILAFSGVHYMKNYCILSCR